MSEDAQVEKYSPRWLLEKVLENEDNPANALLYIIEFQNAILQESELTPIDYIGQLINAKRAEDAGYSMPTRWLTLREDLKSEYRKEAETLFENWKKEEEEMQRRRDDATPDFLKNKN